MKHSLESVDLDKVKSNVIRSVMSRFTNGPGQDAPAHLLILAKRTVSQVVDLALIEIVDQLKEDPNGD